VLATAAHAVTHVMVVGGIGGDPQYEQRFAQWSQTIAQASATTTGDTARVQRIFADAARREAIDAQLQKFATTLREGDELVLVLVGHGSHDGTDYRFNIAGPDVTGRELAAWLDRIPTTVPQLVINATSASGAVAEQWMRPHRVVITATRSGGERNAPRFGGFWAEALTSDAADRDKDGALTAQEAYDFAVRRVNESFKSDAAVVSEHAKLAGGEAARFVVARMGTAALFANDAQLLALRNEQQGIEQRLAQIRALKPQLEADAYFNRLEPVLLELARLGVRVDARLAALGVNMEGAGNASR
jgi:hypothetical protein